MRLDFNTEDEWRMQAAIPTIKFLLRFADKVVILSHRGRPQPSLIRANRRIRIFDKKFSLKKDAKNLSRMLHRPVRFIAEFEWARTKKEIERLPGKSIVVLENLRFLPGEEKNDPKLAKQLSALGDYYVNDAFAVSHRADASVVAITGFLPSYAGPELEKEIKFLSGALRKPRHPMVVILGGGKVSDKLGVVQNLKKQADWFLVGGVAANTLAHLSGEDINGSRVETDRKTLRKLKAFLWQRNLILPVDYKKEKGVIFDIGKKTTDLYAQKIKGAKTILWSGPLGFIEKEKFGRGSLAVARAIAANKKVFSIAGGGETVMFLKKHKLAQKFGFISTGGGAMLEYLAGEKLPGIVALQHSSTNN